MIDISFEGEDKKMLNKTFQRFSREYFDLSLFNTELMSDERLSQFVKLYSCLNDEKNREFIEESLVDLSDETFVKVAEVELIRKSIHDETFIILLSGQSLTNRVIKACRDKAMPEALKYRLRQCIWLYTVAAYMHGEF